MRDSLRHFAAEFVGTFAIVFFGSAVIMMTKQPGLAGLLEVALAHGFVIAAVVTALMRISGHFNPAVTIAFLATRRIAVPMAGLYIVAQLLGAMAAAYTLRAVVPDALFDAARGGGQMVSSDVTTGPAIALEAIATFFMVLVAFGTVVDVKAPKMGALMVGLTVSVGVLAIGPFTGASLNPARSFGPAVAARMYEGQLIYWIGPIVGAVLAAILYDRLFADDDHEPFDHGALRPIDTERSPKARG